MKFLVTVAALSVATFSAVFFWPADGVGQGPLFTCTVNGVHDGDGPIYCDEGEKVRLTAIAARELDETCSPGHPCPTASGASATQELRRLALGQALICEKTGTSYKRTTAWCWRSDGTELNCAMMRSQKVAYWAKFDPAKRICTRPAPSFPGAASH
jgi:endonuclease YncB( thermonuclease family)